MTLDEFFEALERENPTFHKDSFGMLRTSRRECPVCFLANRELQRKNARPSNIYRRFYKTEFFSAGDELGLGLNERCVIADSADAIEGGFRDENVRLRLLRFVK